MKTILILSDTHSNFRMLEKLSPIMQEVDYIFHLGDYVKDIMRFRKFLHKTYYVRGNCDGGGDDLELEIEGVKFLLTHGDKYNVKAGIDELINYAERKNFDVVLYGHTHKASEIDIGKIKYINPGSLVSYSENSYSYMVIANNKVINKIVNIPNF